MLHMVGGQSSMALTSSGYKGLTIKRPHSEPKSLMGKEMYIATIYGEKLDKEVQWKWDSDEAVWQDPTSSGKAKE